jgi:hypothetical protein
MLVNRVVAEVPATLIQAALFGSKARGDARADSDVDVLLIFRWLPTDREPQAGQAEAIAQAIAAEYGVPVTVWSVSLVDLVEGQRTPMLIDALEDALPIWCGGRPVRPVPFTPADALYCGGALLARVAEGSQAFAAARAIDNLGAASTRARDDVVRLCTAWLLLQGITRPRRAEAVRIFASMAYRPDTPPADVRDLLDWVISSFASDGRDDGSPVPAPPAGLAAVGHSIDHLRELVRSTADRLRFQLKH